jgi:hypothetical protein
MTITPQEDDPLLKVTDRERKAVLLFLDALRGKI